MSIVDVAGIQVKDDFVAQEALLVALKAGEHNDRRAWRLQSKGSVVCQS